MSLRNFVIFISVTAIAFTINLGQIPSACAQEDPDVDEEAILPRLPTIGDTEDVDEEEVHEAEELEEGEIEEEEPTVEERIEAGEAGEGEDIWSIVITGAVIMNYVFNNSPDSFNIKYRWEIKGQANAATSVIRGDADITAEVEGFLSKWPTGECKLDVTIPKVPFELVFRRSGGDKGSIRLVFQQAINEDWMSRCTFTDAPGAKFDTRGTPEAWLTRALQKARPPLKNIIANLGDEETTTTLVINKEIIADAPLGSGEIEGTGVVTVKPGFE